MPVIWTHVAYQPDGGDAGVWGTRTNTPDSLQNIRYGSERHAFDPRVEIDEATDMVFTKRMPSAFFETPLASYLVWKKVDTVLITGGSTSGCVRATAVDSLSHGYRTLVAGGMRRRQARELSFRQPDRPAAQIRRRPVGSRGPGLAGGR